MLQSIKYKTFELNISIWYYYVGGCIFTFII